MRLCYLILILYFVGITSSELSPELETSQHICYCKTCNEPQTAGIVYNGNCYFVQRGWTITRETRDIKVYYMDFRFGCDDKIAQDFTICIIPHHYSNEWVRVDRVLKAAYRDKFCDSVQRYYYGKTLDILHRLTRIVYKKLKIESIQVPYYVQQTRDLRLKPWEQKYLQTMIRLPSTDLTDPNLQNNSAYDIKRNIIYEALGAESQLPCIFGTKEFNTKPNPEFQTLKSNFKQYNFTINERCQPWNIYEVDTREKYEMLHDFLFTHFSINATSERAVVLFKFDPTNVPLDNSDYFMHVQTYTHFKNPAGYHILDFGKGKIFQQPDRDTALNVIKMDLDTDKIPMLCRTL